jgi:conjugative relaxase-like TrwC/TraI family protein
VAWMRMMGGASVEYHRKTVVERGDDYPGRALAYYASRGETPLVWGGTGAAGLGLAGTVTAEEYEAVYGPGGARHPESGERLVTTRRPGLELVISAHKSVAELGVIGRAEDMHLIMDAERDATLGYLDQVTCRMGGRRGRAATPSPTGGILYAHTRHATSRAGDPCPHDHVLVANVVEMADGRGGWKAADTALWREHLHAATMVGRVASARVAVELGYGIEADNGPSGRLGHWRIAGVAEEVMAVHSKRAAEIDAECARRGETSYQARSVAARTTRQAKDEGVEADLVERWRAELAEVGWPADRLAAAIDAAGQGGLPQPLRVDQARKILSEILGQDGDLARRKVFAKRHVVVAVAPHLYGQDPVLLEAMVARAMADPDVIPLVGVAGARQQPHSLASVIARETAIADSLARQLDRADAPATPTVAVTAAIADVEAGLGGRLSAEQTAAAVDICTSGRGTEIVVGVAGAGKTTMLRVVAAAFETSGYQVTGTATSGQAAKNLGTEAELAESRTLASLIWRIDHGRLHLDERSVVLCDEVGMTDDIDLLRLATHVEGVGAKLVLIGDHRQLGAVGPGGALQALVARHPQAVHYLTENRRQHDAGERRALAQLRDGQVAEAVSWYERHRRIHAIDNRDQAVQAAVDAWAADVTAGDNAALFAWRRANVDALNQRARAWMDTTGRLSGPEVVCPGGKGYRAGDRVVTLAPGPGGSLVTSQRATVEAVDPHAQAVVLRTDDGRLVRLSGEEAGAERLGYGYATTVHRSQGATVGRAHLFADGGGRELAYVAMSRARQSTHVWAVADDTVQAVEDLQRDWTIRRSPTWAIDIGQPAPKQPDASQVLPTLSPERAVRTLALAKARNDIAKARFVFVRPPDWDQAINQARSDLQRAHKAKADLAQGAGIYHDSEAGHAVRDLRHARGAGEHARWEAEHATRWRERRAAAKQTTKWSEHEADAGQRWQTHAVPEIARLDSHIQQLENDIADLAIRAEKQRAAQKAISERLVQDHRHNTDLTRAVTVYRDHLDGIQPPAPRTAARTVHHQLRVPPPTIRPAPQPELGVGM